MGQRKGEPGSESCSSTQIEDGQLGAAVRDLGREAQEAALRYNTEGHGLLGFDLDEETISAILRFLGDRTDPRAQRIRRLLEKGSTQERIAAIGILLGPDGGGFPIQLALKELFGLLLDWNDRLDRSGLLTQEDRKRLDQASDIYLTASMNASLFDSHSESFRRNLGRCVGCGAKLISRGRSWYCSDACKSARQKARQRERQKRHETVAK